MKKYDSPSGRFSLQLDVEHDQLLVSSVSNGQVSCMADLRETAAWLTPLINKQLCQYVYVRDHTGGFVHLRYREGQFSGISMCFPIETKSLQEILHR